MFLNQMRKVQGVDRDLSDLNCLHKKEAPVSSDLIYSDETQKHDKSSYEHALDGKRNRTQRQYRIQKMENVRVEANEKTPTLFAIGL